LFTLSVHAGEVFLNRDGCAGCSSGAAVDDATKSGFVTCRTRTVKHKPRMENWVYPLELNRPLPTLPLWLAEDVVVALELEASYEETCRVLRIG
jgi:hypothetical protein